MREIRQRRLQNAVWIPLRANQKIESAGRDGEVGFIEDYFGSGSLAVPVAAKEKASRLGWMDIGIGHRHRHDFRKGVYLPSDAYDWRGVTGICLVLDQHTNRSEATEWHLHQDFVLGLELVREEDRWLAANEGYLEVARLRREARKPVLLEARAEQLRDYLCARGMALYVSSYRGRRVIQKDRPSVQWAENPLTEEDSNLKWIGQVNEIHEGGFPFGSEIAVFEVKRTDVDPGEEVPTLSAPTDTNVESKTNNLRHKGRRLFQIRGELWRNDWVEPAELSPRLRNDAIPATVFFITDARGKRESRETLRDASKYLWFRPDVMMALAHRRGGRLEWFTRHTGSVACSPDSGVPFGINGLGLVNAFAKDVALLADWEQAIWAGHNVGPDGGVSDELLAAQGKGEPARTQAPEAYLGYGLELLKLTSQEAFGISLLLEHEWVPEIIRTAHRFRAVDRPGLFALAKDLARLTADSLDVSELRRLLQSPDAKEWRSLRCLEALLATKLGPAVARKMLTPLVGIYELRLADAHLKANEIDEAMVLARVDKEVPLVHQAGQLINSCVSSIYRIGETFSEWKGQEPAGN
jgi:hypothetical protein